MQVLVIIVGMFNLLALVGAFYVYQYAKALQLSSFDTLKVAGTYAFGAMSFISLAYFSVSWVPISEGYCGYALSPLCQANYTLAEVAENRWEYALAFIVSIVTCVFMWMKSKHLVLAKTECVK